MLLLPIETENHRKDVLIVVLERVNLDRMKQGDPVELSLDKMLSKTGHALVRPHILICYEEDSKPLMALVHAGDIRGAIKYLQRGWEFRPDLGDHDRGPESIKDQQ